VTAGDVVVGAAFVPRSDTLQPTAVPAGLGHREDRTDVALASGLAALTESQKQDLLEAIEERHGVGATIITSHASVADWHEYLGGGRIADAMLDRIIYNTHRIELASKDSIRKNLPDLPHAEQSDI
jgi:hypothetical protein